MKILTWIMLFCGLIVLLNGAVGFFMRYNFVTRERYGPSFEPLIILGAGVGILVLWLVLRTALNRRG